jgi:ankyrin repeat protein
MIKKLSLILLLAGAQMHAVIDINGKGVNKQALFIGACSTGNHELAKLLIEAGVNVNHETADGMTLLMKAAQRNDIEMVKLLITAGANVNAKLNNSDYNVLSSAEPRSMSLKDQEQNTEIIKLLLNAGAQINNANFGRALEIIPNFGNGRLDLYLRAGYKLNDNYAFLAQRIGNCHMNHGPSAAKVIKETIMMLANYDLDINKFLNYQICHNHYPDACLESLWHVLVTKGYNGAPCSAMTVPFLQFLFNQGFNFNSKSLFGALNPDSNHRSNQFISVQQLGINNKQTFLICATRYQKTELVEYLLTLENIDVNLTNAEGKTAFDIACETGNIQIIELFQNYFAAQEAKALRSNEQQATNTSVINIANNSNGQLNVLHQVEVPAHSKAEVTTVISKI